MNESAVKKLPLIVYQLMKEKQLRKRWGYYLNDLIRIFDFNNKKNLSWFGLLSSLQYGIPWIRDNRSYRHLNSSSCHGTVK